MYEAKIDVRPVITKFMGYYILLALPLIAIMSVYSSDYTILLKTNPKYYEASLLVPYFSFGVFFLGLADYTTLQYHLANKTHLEFIIKLISGIVGVVLNIMLIPTLGLIGVGIATFSANFLYFLLSAIVVLPDFHLKVPKNTLLRIFIAIVPTAFFSYAYKLGFIHIPGAVQFLLTIVVFYGLYAITKQFIYKTAD
jgi:O-antigen/teichoic acid export membrane protein